LEVIQATTTQQIKQAELVQVVVMWVMLALNQIQGHSVQQLLEVVLELTQDMTTLQIKQVVLVQVVAI
jgi:hypothetical protein